MKQFIEMCDSIYGGKSCVQRFVNINQIVELHIAHTEREINVEALLTSGQRMIILCEEDLSDLIGKDYAQEIMKAIKRLTREN